MYLLDLEPSYRSKEKTLTIDGAYTNVVCTYDSLKTDLSWIPLINEYTKFHITYICTRMYIEMENVYKHVDRQYVLYVFILRTCW